MCVCVESLSRVQLFVSPWTVAHQAPLSMGFSRQEYWSGLPGPPPGDLPNPGIDPRSPALQADYLPSEPGGKPIYMCVCVCVYIYTYIFIYAHGHLMGLVVKECDCLCRRCRRHWFDPWIEKIPWKRRWQPTLIFLPGESHGLRSLVGYSPWDCKELDVTEHAHTLTYACVCVCICVCVYVCIYIYIPSLSNLPPTPHHPVPLG